MQLGVAQSRSGALAQLQAFAEEPLARAEQRSSGWYIRAGAWPDRAQAEQALERLRAGGVRGGRVLKMQTAVPWLLADGSTVPLAGDAPAAPAPAARAEAPARAAAPAVERTLLVPPPIAPATPVATSLKVTPEFRVAAEKLDAEMRRWLRVEGPARPDGFLYGMDLAPLLLYAASRGDRTLYLQILEPARRLIVEDPQDPFTRGFVLWRRKAGSPLDVSGATEALWMARALWTGAAVFGRGEDRTLALSVIDGYARHAGELQGMWLVRKYFSFASRDFASLSQISNYHADFLADVEREAPRAGWAGLAERSYAMIERARTRGGLLNPLIQPEVAATYPDLGAGIYAPNGHAALLDACAGAEGAVRGRPRIADRLLDFATDSDHTVRSGRLYAYFRAEDGEPVGIAELSSTGYACLGRLAAARENRGAFGEFEPFLRLAMRSIADVPSAQGAPLYDGGQLLLAAYAAGAFNP